MTIARYQAVALDMLREVLAQGQSLRFRVISGSMAPLIAVGDIVEVQKATHTHPGDVVVLDGGTYFLTHRLLTTRLGADGEHEFITRGDAMLTTDLPWRPEQLLGRVVAIYRPDGQCIDLTEARWQRMGRLLATAERMQIRLLAPAAWLQRHMTGTGPHRWVRLVARLLNLPLALGVHIMALGR